MTDTDIMPEFDFLTALANQAETVSARTAQLSALKRAVDGLGLDWMEWLLLFAGAVEYRPNLIVELGRSRGNSTCALTEAAVTLGACRVRSYDVDGARAYETVTLPRILPLVSADWLGRQEINHKDITQEDPEDMLRGGRRILVFWDAHGPDVARYVLARLAPALATHEHLIVVHDIVDARYQPAEHQYVTAAGHATCWRSHLMSDCEELDPLFDFVSRNGIRVHTVGRAAWRRCPDVTVDGVVTAAVRGIAGSVLDLFPDPHNARFVHFSCGDRTSARPLVFPPPDHWDRAEAEAAALAGRAAGTTSTAVSLDAFRPNAGTLSTAADGAVQIVTPPVIWAYGASLPLPLGRAVTSGAVRIRAELQGPNPVAFGVAAADGKRFVDRRLVTTSGRVVEVFLNVPHLSNAGDLVVQNWDQPVATTVLVESVTLIVRDPFPEP